MVAVKHVGILPSLSSLPTPRPAGSSPTFLSSIRTRSPRSLPRPRRTSLLFRSASAIVCTRRSDPPILNLTPFAQSIGPLHTTSSRARAPIPSDRTRARPSSRPASLAQTRPSRSTRKTTSARARPRRPSFEVPCAIRRGRQDHVWRRHRPARCERHDRGPQIRPRRGSGSSARCLSARPFRAPDHQDHGLRAPRGQALVARVT
jgi:hypothetical protein